MELGGYIPKIGNEGDTKYYTSRQLQRDWICSKGRRRRFERSILSSLSHASMARFRNVLISNH